LSTYIDPAGHMMISYSTTADHPDSGASFLRGPGLGHTGSPAIVAGGGGTPATSTLGAGSAVLLLAIAGLSSGVLLVRRRRGFRS